jgi:hypothetical protein
LPFVKPFYTSGLAEPLLEFIDDPFFGFFLEIGFLGFVLETTGYTHDSMFSNE